MTEEISIYDLGSGAIPILEAEIVRLQADAAALLSELEAAHAWQQKCEDVTANLATCLDVLEELCWGCANGGHLPAPQWDNAVAVLPEYVQQRIKSAVEPRRLRLKKGA